MNTFKEKKLVNANVGETICMDFHKVNKNCYHAHSQWVFVKKVTSQYVQVKKLNGELAYFLKSKNKEQKIVVILN